MTGDFFELFEQYIQESKSVRSTETIRAYKVAQRVLTEFSSRLKIENITLDTYNGLVKYMAKGGYSNNYIGTIVKRLKAFLRFARTKGYVVHPDVDDPKFKILRETPNIIYLTQSEFEQLRDLKLKTGSLYDKVRDLGILACRTGLRISDLRRLGPQHFSDDMIVIRAYKNKNRVIIPMAPEVRHLVRKYAHNPPKMTDQVFNRNIKLIAEKAEIDTPQEVVTYSGGSKKFKTIPKYELVSSHVMVKTFITHCGERGISAKTVAEITGKTVKVIFQHYYGTNTQTIKSEMERAFG